MCHVFITIINQLVTKDLGNSSFICLEVGKHTSNECGDQLRETFYVLADGRKGRLTE